MTIWDALRAIVHRWYVLALAVLAALAVSYTVVQAPGVYWSRAEVTFLAPTSTTFPNALRTTSSDLVATAAVVAKRVNDGRTSNKMADPSVTLFGEGVRDGWSVRLPDYGGQWARSYPRQVLDVQVVGPTADGVRARQTELVAAIDSELDRFQEGVAARDRVTTTVVPTDPTIYLVTGSRTRALAMVWLLAGAAALAGTVIVDAFSERRRLRATASGRRPDVGAVTVAVG